MNAHAKALWALNGARLYVLASEVMPGSTGIVEVPAPTFLIETDDGLVLVDTGLSPRAVNDEDAVYGDLKPYVVSKMTRDQGVDAQLATIGKFIGDVTHVIISHSHFDHTGGLHLFPHATLVMNVHEWHYLQQQPESDRGPIRRADFSDIAESQLLLFDGDHDLFGDGAVTLLALPGHTPGNTGVLVRLPTRTMLLPMDTVHVRAAYDTEAVLAYDTDQQQARESIRRVKSLAIDTGAEVWIGHDIEDWRRYKAPGRYT
ncbi:N-acyl homoserine lactonase family protein [Streptomyces mirabilis]|uniref:N-acyl homoserine lactonase family protein n=1 Tax=Streptomyces mirabilis TaxID=68239 RepID=UPI003319F844